MFDSSVKDELVQIRINGDFKRKLVEAIKEDGWDDLSNWFRLCGRAYLNERIFPSGNTNNFQKIDWGIRRLIKYRKFGKNEREKSDYWRE